MKTFDEITEEVIYEYKVMVNHIGKNDKYATRMPWQVTGDIMNAAAKRYAHQCCEDVLNRAAERVDVITGYSAIIETTIAQTEIILP